MENKTRMFLNHLKPYKGIIYFIIILLGTHFLWKLSVDGDLNGQYISIFGINMTNQFYYLSQITAKCTYWFVKLFPGTDTFQIKDTFLYFIDGKMKVVIIWGCTGIKQLYIFITIMLFYTGPWKKKLWYIPFGCILLLAYNIIRIAAICGLTRNHPEWFEFLHEGLFRYIYYGLIFLLWLVWEEVIIKKNKKNNA